MALNIKDDETSQLARELARITGESITMAVRRSLLERLQRTRQRQVEPLEARLRAISIRCGERPDLDTRDADEIIGYNEHGVPR